jgi:hypothetical protein
MFERYRVESSHLRSTHIMLATRTISPALIVLHGELTPVQSLVELLLSHGSV